VISSTCSLARADRYLTGELRDGFATVIVSGYEHATGKLTWAKAGHEPPIIAGEPELEEEAATPVGFGFGDTWPQFSRSLAPGERVCLFTDGLVEARRRGEYLGRAHLRSLVEQGLSAQALVERIESDSDLCTDDLAVVVLSRRPSWLPSRLRVRRKRRPCNSPAQAAIDAGGASNATVRFRPARFAV
jgi:serine phosphatase RsbU (regulator of sigma subunit)